jgi:hypothetical protein
MPPKERDGVARATDRFWDEISQGRPGNVTGVDPVDIATIRHLHVHDDRPNPTPAFARRLRAELGQHHAVLVPRSPGPHVLMNDRAANPPVPLSLPEPRTGRQLLWRVVQVGVVLLVVMAGAVAGYLAFAPDGGDDRARIAAPVITVPVPTPTPPAVVDASTLVSFDLPAGSLPSEGYGAIFDHRTMPAQSRATVDDESGLVLRYVLSGAVSVSAAGPMWLRTATGDGAWEELPAGAEVALGPGDAVFFRDAAPITYVNNGAEPVEFIAWMLTDGGGGNSEAPAGWDIGHSTAVHMAVFDRPEAAARVRLRRIELAPADDLYPPAGSLLSQFVYLGVNAEGVTVAPMLGSLPDGGTRNAGRQALTIYQVVLEPQ